MSESFDDMMKREFGDDAPDLTDEPEASAEILALCERHGMPINAVQGIITDLLQAWKALGRIHHFVGMAEREGFVPESFPPELYAIIRREIDRNFR